jgi:hypothetical protein
MGIARLLQGQAFDPEQLAAMAAAYESAIRLMTLKPNDPSRDLLARKIVEYAQRGVQDAMQLSQLAIEAIQREPPYVK